MVAEDDTDVLVGQARDGDPHARELLLDHCRSRLRRMVAARLDPRLAARVDPSDVVQETLAEADRKLDAYLRDIPLPFFPWLRRLAWERLAKLHYRPASGRSAASNNSTSACPTTRYSSLPTT